MPERLGHSSYGKSDVRVTKIVRGRNRHELIEISVDIELSGKFDDTYLHGDNSAVVATDSMKNTIYALAGRHPLDSIESFASTLAEHFTGTYQQVDWATAHVRQTSWQPIAVDSKPHPHAFVAGGSGLRHCTARRTRSAMSLDGGLSHLLVLKTADSAFSGFVRDQYTTLKDTDDRVFATEIEASWHYAPAAPDFNACFSAIRAALLETFAAHRSLSVQQTLYAMGQEALRRCGDIDSIDITMPNKHRLLVDLKPFGLDNENEVFVWTDVPYGNIRGRVERS